MTQDVLIIDDNRIERRLIGRILEDKLGLNPIEADNGKVALKILKDRLDICLIILDLNMPIMDGFQTLNKLREHNSDKPTIVLTGSASLDDAVRAMKAGAHDYVRKPIDQNRLIVTVRNALKLSDLTKEVSNLNRQHKHTLNFSDLIGYDSGLKDCVTVGTKAAQNDLPVLITGETGTGKEVFARAIHGESMRAKHPFIALNCGALPEKLVESILFGHEKGAFTGATEKSLGKFQEANKGTIFLDEVGELPLDLQVKLLRALQQQEIEPVGAARPVNVDVRIISATNRRLEDDVKSGLFREDLFYRLNVLHLSLPALRNRIEDVQAIAEHFINLFCARYKTPKKDLSFQSVAALQTHLWPGNVRELENIINRAMALCENETINTEDLYFSESVKAKERAHMNNSIYVLNKDGSFKPYKAIEQEVIKHALDYHHHNVTQTARVLGLAKSTIYSKIKK
nr:response regulator [Cytophagales bacterium]